MYVHLTEFRPCINIIRSRRVTLVIYLFGSILIILAIIYTYVATSESLSSPHESMDPSSSSSSSPQSTSIIVTTERPELSKYIERNKLEDNINNDKVSTDYNYNMNYIQPFDRQNLNKRERNMESASMTENKVELDRRYLIKNESLIPISDQLFELKMKFNEVKKARLRNGQSSYDCRLEMIGIIIEILSKYLEYCDRPTIFRTGLDLDSSIIKTTIPTKSPKIVESPARVSRLLRFQDVSRLISTRGIEYGYNPILWNEGLALKIRRPIRGSSPASSAITLRGTKYINQNSYNNDKRNTVFVNRFKLIKRQL